MRPLFAVLAISLCACAQHESLPGAPATELAAFAAKPAAEVQDRDPLRTASYDLTARLDPQTHQIHGTGFIHLANTSAQPLSVLWFHLYLNAFKNERSVFLQEKTSGFRGHSRNITWGSCDVTHLSTESDAGTIDLLAHQLVRGDDETELAVELPDALAPGASISLRIEWISKLPSVVLRTGFAGSFHMAGQWFPKLAKLEADGFAHFPFHRFSEFYADFGDYRIRIDTPESFVIGASGVRESESKQGGRRTETYAARGVHDFAFTAWDGFVERNETIEGVAVRALAPAGYESVVERELATLRFALPHYRARYGRYPYPTLTVVHPPIEAGEAGGMEYPSLITTGGDPRTPGFVRTIEAVTMHEFGHQYFYGMLASNEHRVPFLDEGLNSFAEIDSLETWLGRERAGANLGLIRVGIADVHALAGRKNVQDTHIDVAATAFPTGGAYGSQVYSRTASLLETLRRVYGDARFFTMLGTYTRRFRFRHPTETDLLAVVASELDERARLFLATGLSASGTLDVLVLEASSTRRREPAGLFGPLGARHERKAEAGRDFISTIVVSRRGALSVPVDIELRFVDGSRTRRLWDSGDAHTEQLTVESSSALASVIMDPERKLLVDDNWENNALVIDRRDLPKARHPLLVSSLAALLAEAL